jgi:uncharacterized protein YrrD
MLRKAHDIYGLRLLAQDGALGHVDDILFDDRNWMVRYLVATTGVWLIGRRVLVPRPAIKGVDSWGAEGVEVDLTTKQIEESPDLKSAEPLTRAFERATYDHYGWPLYWNVEGVAGGAQEQERDSVTENHLQSCRDVDSYHVHATDGEIGHVSDLIFDEATWQVRYLVVDTRNWLPGKHVLVTPDRVRHATAHDRVLYVALTRATIENAPVYDRDTVIDDAYEATLREYYEAEAGAGVR